MRSCNCRHARTRKQDHTAFAVDVDRHQAAAIGNILRTIPVERSLYEAQGTVVLPRCQQRQRKLLAGAGVAEPLGLAIAVRRRLRQAFRALDRLNMGS